VSNLGNFVWSIADQLRGPYKPAQYGSVVLPMTILRRMECVLAEHKDEIVELAGTVSNPDHLEVLVRKKFDLNFYNTSTYTLKKLLGDPDNLDANLVEYLAKFSPNVVDIFERYGFEKQIKKLAEKDRLFLVVDAFSEVDLSPGTVDNADMGSVFEDLIRRFAAASNETAGEHFTPRDAIHLMVDLLFAPDAELLTQPAAVRTCYDPTAGTGGMLSVAEEHLLAQNPDARLVMAGQELNDESYAICKSDLVIKGQDASSIRLGDTLANDLHEGKTFDYCLSNPPYGGDWKAAEKVVRKERAALGSKSRFPGGLPRISDGQMLFLQHLVSKMRPASQGGGRAGIVLNGSPLFAGGAGSGESEIRRWLLESDLVDAIVALPTSMFYNTGIATYVWLLDNAKPAQRRGKVQLIDASAQWVKRRRNLGSKTRDISDEDRAVIAKIYDTFADGPCSLVLEPDDLKYWEITVERPLRLRFRLTEQGIAAAMASPTVAKLSPAEVDAIASVLGSLPQAEYMDRAEFLADLRGSLKDAGVKVPAPTLKAIWMALGERDEAAAPCLRSDGSPEPDVGLRDTEVVPFRTGVEPFLASEVLPFIPDAWVDPTKTKVGYEIPFTRLFYQPVVPRPLEAIDAELDVLVAEIRSLLQEVDG
jgi:type I restriction enzyme M protein